MIRPMKMTGGWKAQGWNDEPQTLTEISRYLGLHHSALFNMRKRNPETFPDPAVGKLYWPSDIVTYRLRKQALIDIRNGAA